MKKLRKVSTLFLFTLLMALFVLYKSQYAGMPIMSNPNGDAIKEQPNDSPVTVHHDSSFLRMASSKSIVLIDPVQKRKDSIKFEKFRDSLRRKKLMLAGSKSMILLDRNGNDSTVKTSVSNDSAKKRKPGQ